MSLKYLLDENIPHALRDEMRRSDAAVVVRVVGEVGSPPLGTLDPDILRWCETHRFILFTNNRGSMPVHLADHASAGGSVPGVFLLKPGWTLVQTAEHLVLVAGASFDDEYENQVRHLPVE